MYFLFMHFLFQIESISWEAELHFASRSLWSIFLCYYMLYHLHTWMYDSMDADASFLATLWQAEIEPP